MSESFYFSKDCLSRDKRRKGEIEERTSEILFIEVGIFERKFRSLERKTGEEEGKVFARQTPWRVLMPRICETQEENGNGRERERQFSSKGNVECENVAPHLRVVTSNCTRKHWKFSLDRTNFSERERERKVRIFYICARDARILTVTSVCLKQKSWRLFFSFESTDFFLFFPFLFLFLRREETAVEEVVHRSF